MKRIKTAWIWLLLLAVAILISGWITWHGTAILDGDTSSDMVFAKKLWDEGALFSQDWMYSTEIRVFQSHLIWSPLFGVFSSWHVVRFVGTMLMQMLLVLAWAFLAWGLGCSLRRFCQGAILFLCPFSLVYGRIVLYHAHYLMYLIHALLLTGLIPAWGRVKGSVGRILLWAASLLCSVLAGCGGLRLILCVAAPGTLALLCTSLQKVWKEKQTVGKGIRSLVMDLLPVLPMLLGFALGWILYHKVILTRFDVAERAAEYMLMPTDMDHMGWALVGYLKDYGFNYSMPLLGAAGITAVAGATAAVLLPWIAWQRAKAEETDPQGRFISLFFLWGLLITGTVFFLVSGSASYDTYPRYILLSCCFALPMLMTIREEKPDREGKHIFPGPVRLLSLCCALTFLLSGAVTGSFFLHPERRLIDYDDGLHNDALIAARLTDTVDFLTREGYELGIAVGPGAHWYASVITEMTNGKVSILPLENDDHFTRYLVSRKAITSPERLREKKNFAIIENASGSELYLSLGLDQGAKVRWQDDAYTVVKYEDPVQVFERFFDDP